MKTLFGLNELLLIAVLAWTVLTTAIPALAVLATVLLVVNTVGYVAVAVLLHKANRKVRGFRV